MVAVALVAAAVAIDRHRAQELLFDSQRRPP